MHLTPRQCEILKAIIEEHSESAHPIASIELVRRRGWNLSGATVRNVMSDLVQKGYLHMIHVSSGREPTELAYRLYISELMQEVPVSVLDEIAIKQKLISARYEVERLLKNTASVLSDVTTCLAFALTADGYSTYSGASKILDMPEFYEIDTVKAALKLVDDYELAKSVVGNMSLYNGVGVLIGREIGLAHMEPVTLVVAATRVGTMECYLGVLGASRLHYERIIPIVRHAALVMHEVGESL